MFLLDSKINKSPPKLEAKLDKITKTKKSNFFNLFN